MLHRIFSCIMAPSSTNLPLISSSSGASAAVFGGEAWPEHWDLVLGSDLVLLLKPLLLGPGVGRFPSLQVPPLVCKAQITPSGKGTVNSATLL